MDRLVLTIRYRFPNEKERKECVLYCYSLIDVIGFICQFNATEILSIKVLKRKCKKLDLPF